MRVSRKFNPDSCDYRLGKTRYSFQPALTRIKYYEFEDGEYTAVLAHEYFIVYFVLIVALSLSILYGLMQIRNSSRVVVELPKSFIAQDNKLSLGINTSASNSNEVLCQVTYKDEMLYEGKIKPGGSVGCIKQAIDLTPGDYPVTVKISIENKVEENKQVLLRVR